MKAEKMSGQAPPQATPEAAGAGYVNEVRLVGRVAGPPEQRTLPSGDALCTVRIIVDRPAAAVRGTSKVDTLDCAVWAVRLRRTVGRWAAGDVVEVHGSLRRRFYRAGVAVSSRVDVEVSSARLLTRAAGRSRPVQARRVASG